MPNNCVEGVLAIAAHQEGRPCCLVSGPFSFSRLGGSRPAGETASEPVSQTHASSRDGREAERRRRQLGLAARRPAARPGLVPGGASATAWGVAVWARRARLGPAAHGEPDGGAENPGSLRGRRTEAGRRRRGVTQQAFRLQRLRPGSRQAGIYTACSNFLPFELELSKCFKFHYKF